MVLGLLQAIPKFAIIINSRVLNLVRHKTVWATRL